MHCNMFLKQLIILFLLSISSLHVVLCARFLLICLNKQGISHKIELLAAGEELANRGHEVYLAEPRDSSSSASAIVPSNVNVLFFKPLRHIATVDEIDQLMMEFHLSGKFFDGTLNQLLLKLMKDECESALADEEFIAKVKTLKFHMAVVGGWPFENCAYLLPHYVNIPYVSLGSSIYEPWLGGSPTFASFSYHVMKKSGDQMNFWQRLENALVQLTVRIIIKYDIFTQNCTDLLEKYSRGSSSFFEIFEQSQLFFVTRDRTLEWPMSSMPNVIEVPALAYRPAKQLPVEFEEVVSSAENGVVLVSFGSMANYLPQEILQKMINVFKRLNQTVIWKVKADAFNKQELTSHSTNVHIVKWFPQNDLLGHKNVKLFITHSGNNGQYEAVYHAVPLVTFPLQLEQIHNSYRISSRGCGIFLDIRDFTEEMLFSAIVEVLTNASYAENIKKLSAILRDHPSSPRETVAHWIEHVTKFGHQHLRSNALNLTWYEYFMVDVILFVATVFGVMIGIFTALCRLCCRVTRIKNNAVGERKSEKN